MKKQKLIGVSGSWMIDSGGMFPGYRRAYVNDDYIRSVHGAGALPVILPYIPDNGEREAQIDQYLQTVDGVILSGGHDLYMPFYGEEILPKLSDVWPERDTFDRLLMERAIANGKGVMGICRGFQIINMCLGGKMLQDVSYSPSPLIKHWQGHTPDMPFHKVSFEKDNSFYELFGESVMTNSFHHLVITAAGQGLTVCGRTSDGVIEAVEDKARKIIATQWHPEMMTVSSEAMRKFFRYFVESVC